MKAAFQKDERLLENIADARSRGARRLWWLGQSGFLLTANGRTILFDPYLSDSLTSKYAGTDKPHERLTERVVGPEKLTGVDVITSSHNHTDHLDRDTLVPLLKANPQARLVIPQANRTFVLERLGSVDPRLVEIDADEPVVVEDIEFIGIPAAHNEVERDEQGRCRFLGYVMRFAGLSIYHSGDTLVHPGLASALRPYPIDVALLPINGNRPERHVAGNMTGAEAAALAWQIGAGLVVPHHFDMFAFNTESPDQFESECRRLGQSFRTLQQGESIDLIGKKPLKSDKQ